VKEKMKVKANKLFKNNIFILTFVLILICVALSFSTKYFATTLNLTTILQQMSINGVLAIGMTLCIITAGINLSVGSVLSLCGVVLALALSKGVAPVFAILLSLLCGAVCGLTNGLLVTRGKIPPFIVTLGMQSIAAGLALMLTDGRPITGVSESIVVLGSGKIGIIPISFFIMACCFVLVHVVMTRTRPGRYMYTIGGNEEAARLSGINLNIYKALPFVISGLLSGIAAIIMTGKLNSAEPIAGSGLELDAIAASVIGGTSMNGGEGKIFGTFLGALIMSVIRNGMIQLGVGTYPQQVVIGVIIIVVVLIDMMNRKKSC
jgi:ribose/xylose/arabinose/galactoside ABC-type transport system permease subunit